MKVFFFYIGVPTPVFETELELIRSHEKSGDKVYVFQCAGNLANCHWNPDHKISICAVCRSRFDKGWSTLNPGKNVTLFQFPQDNIDSSSLLIDFTSVEELKLFRYDQEKIGYGVASSLISLLHDHRFDTQKNRHEIFRTLISSVQVYETLKKEFKEIEPDKVYIFNGRIANHLPAVLLCKRMGIDFYTYEVATNLNHYKLWKNATTHNISVAHNEMEKYWIEGGRERERIAREWFELKRAGKNRGRMISFTNYQSKGLLPENFNPNKRNIVIFNSTIDEYAAIEGFENLLYEPDETAGIKKIIESFESDRYMFYLRVHPHMKKLSRSGNSQLRDIDELVSRFSNLHVIWPAEIIDSYALMDACKIVITFGSTIGVEAAYWGKPSILAGSHGIYQYLGCVYIPKTHEELVKLIAKEDLQPLPGDSALKYGFRELSEQGYAFKYFKQTGSESGTFDGVEIRPDLLPWLWFKFTQFTWRVKRILLKPSILKLYFSNKQPT